MMRRQHWVCTQQILGRVLSRCGACDSMSLCETLARVVFSHVSIGTSEASISALIVFLPFALCFLEHGLPVAMQNILAARCSFP